MNWHDDALTRMKYLHAEDGVFDAVPLWSGIFSMTTPWRVRPISPFPPRTQRTSKA